VTPTPKSSNVAEVGTDGPHLLIKFRDGALYRYENAAEHHDGLVSAKSAGQYLHQNLKGPNQRWERLS
jgi:hypothetical protein